MDDAALVALAARVEELCRTVRDRPRDQDVLWALYDSLGEADPLFGNPAEGDSLFMTALRRQATVQAVIVRERIKAYRNAAISRSSVLFAVDQLQSMAAELQAAVHRF